PRHAGRPRVIHLPRPGRGVPGPLVQRPRRAVRPADCAGPGAPGEPLDDPSPRRRLHARLASGAAPVASTRRTEIGVDSFFDSRPTPLPDDRFFRTGFPPDPSHPTVSTAVLTSLAADNNPTDLILPTAGGRGRVGRDRPGRRRLVGDRGCGGW